MKAKDIAKVAATQQAEAGAPVARFLSKFGPHSKLGTVFYSPDKTKRLFRLLFRLHPDHVRRWYRLSDRNLSERQSGQAAASSFLNGPDRLAHERLADLVDGILGLPIRTDMAARNKVFQSIAYSFKKGELGPFLKLVRDGLPPVDLDRESFNAAWETCSDRAGGDDGWAKFRDDYLTHCWLPLPMAKAWGKAWLESQPASATIAIAAEQAIRPEHRTPKPERPAVPTSHDEWKSVFVAEALEELGFEVLSGMPNHSERHIAIADIVRRKQREKVIHADGVSERPVLDAWRTWCNAVREARPF
jgi:hypothetical protein